jgi:hypothetical protein
MATRLALSFALMVPVIGCGKPGPPIEKLTVEIAEQRMASAELVIDLI